MAEGGEKTQQEMNAREECGEKTQQEMNARERNAGRRK